MTQITTKELYKMIAKCLCENERIYYGDDFKAIRLNGVLIFYTTYVIEYEYLDSDDFTIHFLMKAERHVYIILLKRNIYILTITGTK